MKMVEVEQLDQLPLDEIIIVDVRTRSEYAREHIANSINIPIDQLQMVDTSQWQGKTLLFHCKSGHRTRQAQALIDQIACKDALCLQGGIEQWKQFGNPIIKNSKAPLELMRQVQIIAGLLILLGVLLSYLVSPYFIILPAFVGLGLFTAGVTGFCGMANLLMLLPYNKRGESNVKTV